MLPDHDRKIAEIHLMIALSYEFVPSTTKDINTAAGEASRIKAVEHAQKAKEVLVLRKKYLEAQDKTGDTEAELQDIDEVLTELDAKVLPL